MNKYFAVAFVLLGSATATAGLSVMLDISFGIGQVLLVAGLFIFGLAIIIGANPSEEED